MKRKEYYKGISNEALVKKLTFYKIKKLDELVGGIGGFCLTTSPRLMRMAASQVTTMTQMSALNTDK
jgi:hypothetical protein